jgi:Pentapeptide repeats (9 copies)
VEFARVGLDGPATLMAFHHSPIASLSVFIVAEPAPAAASNPGWVNVLSAVVALVAALLGLGQYLRFRSRREQQEAIGHAFSEVVRGLGSESEVERLASAALTRRFFDRNSEFSVGGHLRERVLYFRRAAADRRLPYADSAVQVVSGVLRSEPAGATQKLLADGLQRAPLAYKDFQRANLRDCYWGAGATDTRVDAQGADFYGADLSTASLRRAILSGAVFREAELVRTIFDNADCTKADFRGANLRGASFNGALLKGARFDNAHQIPAAISANLGPDGRYGSPEPLAAPTDFTPAEAPERRIFISAPSHLDRVDEVALEQVLVGLKAAGIEAVRVLPAAYAKNAPMSQVARKIQSCGAVIIFGPPLFHFACEVDPSGSIASHPLAMSTPWNHIEAGMAVGLEKPLLVLRQGANGGVFDLPDQPEMLTVLDVTAQGSVVELADRVSAWARACAP